jgi:hypothetical protein
MDENDKKRDTRGVKACWDESFGLTSKRSFWAPDKVWDRVKDDRTKELLNAITLSDNFYNKVLNSIPKKLKSKNPPKQ